MEEKQEEGTILPHSDLEMERNKMREKLTEGFYVTETKKGEKLDDLVLHHSHVGGTERCPSMNMRPALTDEDVHRIAEAVWEMGGQGSAQTLEAISTPDLIRELASRDGVGLQELKKGEHREFFNPAMSEEKKKLGWYQRWWVKGPATILAVRHSDTEGGDAE